MGVILISTRQIKLDRIIQTHGATISRSVTGYLPAGTVLGPTKKQINVTPILIGIALLAQLSCLSFLI